MEVKVIEIQIEGMTCSNCATGIKIHLEKHDLKNVTVNFSTGEARYELNDMHNEEDIIKIIKQLGYKIKSHNKIKKRSKTYI